MGWVLWYKNFIMSAPSLVGDFLGQRSRCEGFLKFTERKQKKAGFLWSLKKSNFLFCIFKTLKMT